MRDVLRAELGFRGVCFTDALEMEAIAGSVGSARAAVLALAAGVDCVVAAAGLELAREVRAAVIAALESGELPVARLREACARIARLREGLPSPRQRHAEHADHAAGADDADDAGIGMEIARRSITLLHGDPRLDLTQPLSLVSFEGSEFDGAADAAAEAGAKGTAERPSLNLALRRRHVRSELLRVALDPAPEMLAQLLELIQTQRRQVAIVIRRAHRHPSQAHALDALLTIAPQAIVVSALEPFDAPLAKRARAVLCSYGDGETAIEAVADVLTGRLEPRGTLPVRLERAG
jgi:beta-N-acetylhexosaminidase